ncbi:MAG: 2-oxoglutarate oxidoreductase [Deltaproteobacteria bacterium]|nr:2-oxoglutarate oxidoreductase [Deltaproteobacteria bacterium]
MKQIFARPASLTGKNFHFCPGCHHGIVHRLVAEAIDYFDLRERTVGIASVGCSVFLYDYFAIDVIEAPHGRAAAVATGTKRVLDDRIVFTYQGDGDLAAIGTAEIIHAANRGENITVIFVNNSIYGMTGGQMAPTTMLGQQSTTSPYGRDCQRDGYPIKMAEMLAALEGPSLVARVAVDRPPNVKKARKVIRQAFQMQVENKGFSFVEVLSACPTNWGLNPQQAVKRVAEEMIPYFPLGVLKQKDVVDVL